MLNKERKEIFEYYKSLFQNGDFNEVLETLFQNYQPENPKEFLVTSYIKISLDDRKMTYYTYLKDFEFKIERPALFQFINEQFSILSEISK